MNEGEPMQPAGLGSGAPEPTAPTLTAGAQLQAADTAPTPAPATTAPAHADSPAQQRSMFWPTLWICGALLWSYVVLGQLVVEVDFPEALAWMVVAGVFAGVWVRAQRGGSVWRTWAPGVLALVLFTFEVGLASSFLGTSRRSVAAAVSLALGLFGVAQFFVGRSLTAAPRLELHRNQRIALIVLWVIVAGCTAVVLLSMLS